MQTSSSGIHLSTPLCHRQFFLVQVINYDMPKEIEVCIKQAASVCNAHPLTLMRSARTGLRSPYWPHGPQDQRGLQRGHCHFLLYVGKRSPRAAARAHHGRGWPGDSAAARGDGWRRLRWRRRSLWRRRRRPGWLWRRWGRPRRRRRLRGRLRRRGHQRLKHPPAWPSPLRLSHAPSRSVAEALACGLRVVACHWYTCVWKRLGLLQRWLGISS